MPDLQGNGGPPLEGAALEPVIAPVPPKKGRPDWWPENPTRVTDGSGRERPGPGADAARRLRDPDAVPEREPKPLPEGVGPGEFQPKERTEEQEQRVEEVRQRLRGKTLASVHYRGRSLEKVAADLSEAAGIPVELSGDDLKDEPMEGFFPDSDALDRLLQIAVARNLRFELQPEKIVLRR